MFQTVVQTSAKADNWGVEVDTELTVEVVVKAIQVFTTDGVGTTANTAGVTGRVVIT